MCPPPSPSFVSLSCSIDKLKKKKNRKKKGKPFPPPFNQHLKLAGHEQNDHFCTQFLRKCAAAELLLLSRMANQKLQQQLKDLGSKLDTLPSTKDSLVKLLKVLLFTPLFPQFPPFFLSFFFSVFNLRFLHANPVFLFLLLSFKSFPPSSPVFNLQLGFSLELLFFP